MTIPKPGGVIFVIFLAGLAAGCAGLETRFLADELAAGRGHPEAVRACAEAFEITDRKTVPAADGEAARIPGFPYLRVNRFLASFARNVRENAMFEAWLARLRDLDRQARRIERANLPEAGRRTLAVSLARLDRCAETLMRHDFAQPSNRAALRRGARVPDAYDRWAQVAGLYPLSLIPVRFGIMHLQDRQRADFKAGRANTAPVHSYAPASPAAYDPAAVQTILKNAPRDALGIPLLTASTRAKLLAAFAPVYEIASQGNDDTPGRPAYGDDGRLRVDTKDPTVYRRLTFTRFHKRILVQLVYTIWFPARTATGPLDLFAGTLDGLIWRVTLGADGRPILYDSIHPCGCYHLFFPVPPWHLSDADQHGFHAEPPVAPIPGPVLRAGQRLHLRLHAGNHYLTGVRAARDGTDASRTYRLADEADLRSLPDPGGRRSLYGPDGLVAASARPERFLLWPMGVPSAGAMRQWGHHATAFIGTRHFDDADLVERVLAR